MRFWFAAIAALIGAFLFPQDAFAQAVPRIKAKILSFDGQTLNVTTGEGKNVQEMSVGLLPTARIVRQERRALTDIAVGDYVGVTVTTSRDASLHAQEVHVFPEELRGSSEGVVPAGNGRSMIDATVRGVTPGVLSVDYRGADSADGAPCTGRAPPSGGCHGSADILVAPGVPVAALMAGDKSLLVPGAVIALSVMAGPDGRPVTPGLTVQPAAPDPSPASPAHGPVKPPGH